LILGSLLALVLVFGGSARLHAQSIAVMVNGEPITAFDIEQRAKLNALTGGKTPDRKAVLDELIDEKLKIKEAKKYGVDPTANDIEQSFG
ncbi:SurA N-terminal domain-containing protein, partial [Salmonella enterica]|uniref:SurA N-terminal domain-containing protein n=2 Tax=Pseudomonadota TaxID=1224 RepID=UPI0021B2F9B9